MSQSHSGNYMDYMDGVPVKISEKYKPPPVISLPYGVIESTSRATELIQSVDYDFNLENNVLKKLVEWQNMRETLKNERNHRIQLLEEARQREIDLKTATEIEEKMKQLSISEVSYPSTEEISEISPDDNEETKPTDTKNTSYSFSSDTSPQIPCQTNVSENYSESFPEKSVPYVSRMTNLYSANKSSEKNKSEFSSDILQPTPVSPNVVHAPTNLLDDPDPIQQFHQHFHNKLQSNLSYLRPYTKHNLDNLTFSDFENDTSSPFDNMELKTINDLELLAQVLNTNQPAASSTGFSEEVGKATINQPSNGLINQSYSNTHSTRTDIYSSKPTYCNVMHNNFNDPAMLPYTYASGLNNEYYNNDGRKIAHYSSSGPVDITSSTTGPTERNYYSPEYVYSPGNSVYQQIPNINQFNPSSNALTYSESSDQHVDIGRDKYQRDTSNTTNQLVHNPYEYYGTNNYTFYPASGYPYFPTNSTVPENEELKTESKEPTISFGSRSRSVPDIVRELDEEVAVARQRARERSHNCSPALRPVPVIPSSSVNKESNAERLPDPFVDLSPTLQAMCQEIGSMGFPLDRVARACKDVGSDDKKIVEYLLFMGQLMDLGFSESKVAKALLQHNCNRDKALDELIS